MLGLMAWTLAAALTLTTALGARRGSRASRCRPMRRGRAEVVGGMVEDLDRRQRRQGYPARSATTVRTVEIAQRRSPRMALCRLPVYDGRATESQRGIHQQKR